MARDVDLHLQADPKNPLPGRVRLYANLTGTLRKRSSAGVDAEVGGGGGGGGGNVSVIGPYLVNFDDANVLTTGVELWTPAVGDHVVLFWADEPIAFTGSGGWAKSGIRPVFGSDIVDFPYSWYVPFDKLVVGTDLQQMVITNWDFHGQITPVLRFKTAAGALKCILVPDDGAMTAGQLAVYALVAPA